MLYRRRRITELSAKPNTEFSNSLPLGPPDQKHSATLKYLNAPATISPFGFLLNQILPDYLSYVVRTSDLIYLATQV